jgi:pimeloyl-ACP methyl ester carboxylesterase
MTSNRWRRVGALLLLCAAAWPAHADRAPAECRIAGIKNGVLCGSVTRPLDPAQPQGRSIEVQYVVVPAMARNKLPDPVFLLAGGPGQSAIEVAPKVLPLLQRLNNRRDLVFVDQRGTGRSAPLECEDPRHLALAEQSDPERQLRLLVQCRDRLAALPYGDLRQFTTTIAMQDLDAVRAQLGAERIDLVGVSYGTRAALEYQRQFPQHVRRSVIDGVAPPDMVLPASIALDGQAALDGVFVACEAEPACRQARPALRADWARLLDGLPRQVSVAHPLTGRTETFTLTREMLLSTLRGPLYVPSFAAALPHAMGEATRGRFEPLFGLNALFGARRGMALAMGMHFSVVCAEDAPRMSTQPPPAGDFGASVSRLYERACAVWPRGSVPAAFYGIAPAPAPVMLLSGGLDPVTPPRHGERVARALGANALHVVVPNAGHGVLGVGCMADVLFRFIDAGSERDALAVDAGCVKAFRVRRRGSRSARSRRTRSDPHREPGQAVHRAGRDAARRGVALEACAGARREGRAAGELRCAGRPHHRAAGAQRGRQDDHAAHAGRADRAGRGAHARRRHRPRRAPARGARPAGTAERRTRAVPAADRAREHRVLRASARHGARRRTCTRRDAGAPARDGLAARPSHRRLQPGRAHEDRAGTRAGARPVAHRARRADQRTRRAGHRALRDALRPAAHARGRQASASCSRQHIMQEVERLCDSVVVIAHGRTVARGTVGRAARADRTGRISRRRS